jgi:hypothetical protein
MNSLDIDWAGFIRLSTEWAGVSLDAKKALLSVATTRGDVSAEVAPHGPELLATGFLIHHVDGVRVHLNNDRRAFVATIRVLSFYKILHQPTDEALWNYLDDNFTFRQRWKFCPEAYGHKDINDSLTGRVTSEQWVSGLCKAAIAKSWPLHGTNGAAPFQNSAAFKTLQTVVRKLMTVPEPIAFKDLPDTFKRLSVDRLGSAIHGAIGAFLLFPGIRSDDLMPIIGLHPTIVSRLHRVRPKKPKAIKPDEIYHGAPMMDDMTAVMVSLAVRPARVRASDGAIFAKTRKEIEESLVPFPDWFSRAIDIAAEKRVETALFVLKNLELVEEIGESGTDRSAHATNKGVEWLTANAKIRLQAVLDHLRPKKARQSNEEIIKDGFQDIPREWGGYEESLSFQLAPRPIRIHGLAEWNMTAELANAFKALRGERFVGLRDFLAWHSQEENPLLQLPDDDTVRIEIGWSFYSVSVEQMETLWENSLLDLIFTRLIPLGGVRVGRCGDDLSISLTDAGRYLLGLAKDFDYGHQGDTDQVVLVQPNFDIVFIAPSPRAEASLASFAKRQGHGVGTLFKITKQSVMAAAAAGMSADNLLDTLKSISTKDVPANVTREITGWFAQCRRLTVTRAMLIHCPDAQTAAHVVSAAGKRATALTDTIIELEDTKTNTALFKKLDGMGIFSDLPAPPPAKRRKKRRRQTRW